MTTKRVASEAEQPDKFKFDGEYRKEISSILEKYPSNCKQSAIMPLLDLAQRQFGWIPIAAINTIADVVSVNPRKVHEVASFYTMYNMCPVGKYLIQVCRTTSCWLCGSDAITSAFKSELGIGNNETTSDELFTLMEVECLGACIDAPVVQINDDYYENLTPESVPEIIEKLRSGVVLEKVDK